MKHHDRLIQSTIVENDISRRKFMQHVTAIGAITASGSYSSNLFAAPKKGGVLRLAISGLPTTGSLDPATDDGETAPFIFGTLRNNLTEILGDGSLVGELAESFEASSDATEWTFKLRQGVEFHNGKTLSVDDVIASINHHRGDDTNSSAKTYFESIVDIKSDGSDRVVFKLNAGNADFPFLLADYHMSIMPVKDGKADWQSGVGTGPYVLDSYTPGIRASANNFDNYWKPDHGNFDRVEFTAINDVSARTMHW